MTDISSAIRSGEVVCMPTDTVYGLVSIATNPDAVARMYELKRREGKPGTLVAANIEQLENLGFSREELKIAQQFWPGPTSVVLDAPESLAHLHMGLNSLAVRIPKPKWLQELLLETGPLATTSANITGEPTVSNINQAKEIFSDKVDFYVDGGDLSGLKPSAIYRLLADDSFEKLR